MAKSHQSVTMVELFYDLIFAYAVGRMAQTLAVPVHGMIAPQVLVEFLLMLLVFWTIWTFQTVLIDRFSHHEVTHNLFTLFNMFWVIVLSTAINPDFAKTKWPFQLSAAILFLSLASQYGLLWRRKHSQLAKTFGITLAACSFVILISLFIKPYTLSFAVFFGGVLAAGLMPLLLRNVLKATPADLGNLSTRYSLLVLLIFGESIIGVAETIYAGLSLQAGLFFLVVILLFIAYQLVYDNGLDRRQKTAGLAVIYLQLPLLAAILSLSTFIHSWLAGLLDPQWFALAITVTLAVYYFSLIGYLSAYPVKHIDIGFKRWFYLGFSVLIFGIFSFMTTIMPLPFMFGLTAYLLANTLYLWQFIIHPNDAMYNKLG